MVIWQYQTVTKSKQCFLYRQVSHTTLPHEVMLRKEESRSLARVLHMLQCTHHCADFDMLSEIFSPCQIMQILRQNAHFHILTLAGLTLANTSWVVQISMVALPGNAYVARNLRNGNLCRFDPSNHLICPSRNAVVSQQTLNPTQYLNPKVRSCRASSQKS